MKIVYIITRYFPAIGGGEIHTHELVKRLSQRHEVRVITQLDENRTDFLEAAKEVWETFPNTYFVFIGPRFPESVKVFSQQTDPRIIELNTLSLEEKTSALAACDIFCMPSTQESFGGVFLEAWMMGKPVIAGDIPCERELIQNGEDGFLVKQEPKQIAQRIIQLLENEGLRRRMGQRGREKVLAKYTWEKIVEKMEEIYKALIKNCQESKNDNKKWERQW